MTRRTRVLTIWVKAQTFQLIESGQKDLLVRSVGWMTGYFRAGVCVDICATIKNKERRCKRQIVAIRSYSTMLEIVDHEDLARLAHGNKVQTLSYLARIYRKEEEEGEAVVLELKPFETSEEPC